MVFNLRTFSSPESVENDPTPPKSFSLKELQRVTDNFSGNNYMGFFPCGKVYKGRLADGSLVAVFRASYVELGNKKSIETEVQVGSTVSTHPNVLRLRGFCRIKNELLGVYPLMINKTLYYHLVLRPDRSTRPLDWPTRKRIALGAARGLAHLHNQGNVKIMHRDICSSSIFLNDQFEAVIGNFWRAIIMHDGNAKEGTIQWPRLKHPVRVSSSSQEEESADSDSYSLTYHLYEDVYVDTTYADGKADFIAPEYLHTGKCTLRNDVHAFGKLLLELISGQPPAKLDALAYDENLSLEEWIGEFMNKNELGRLIDPNLQGNYVEEEEAEKVVRLALLCAHKDPSVRPEMSEVVEILESQLLQRDSSTRSSLSLSECESTNPTPPRSFSSADGDDPTPPRSFSLKEVRDATNHFSHGNIMGRGDFGAVYRGRLADGSVVAVKRAVTIDQEREEFFEREMQVANSVSLHPNVLNLRGFCRTKRELLLIYPLMIHNSLASNLGERWDRSTGPLDWTTRKRIALGAARGLAHLHNQGNIRIMHRHICPDSILLNAQFEAVVAGFCAAVIIHERNVQEGTTKNRVEDSVASDSGSQAYNCYDYVYDDNFIHGVWGFIAPEYSDTGKCTLKNDVFAFGRTLLELISGQVTGDLFLLGFGKHINLEERTDGGIIKNELKTLIDPELQGKYPEEEAEGLVQLALLCAHDDPWVRPEMSQVLRMLETQLVGQDPSSRSSRSLKRT